MFYGLNTLWLNFWFKGFNLVHKLLVLFGYDTLVYIYISKMFFIVLWLVCVCAHVAFVSF